MSAAPLAPADASRGTTPLRRAVPGPLLFVFVLGDVLGAGIYALVGEIAGRVGGAVWLPLAVALGLALLTAGSYAELVTRFPRAGGAAVFAQEAFGRPLVSFLVGFSMLAAAVTSAAGLALAFGGDYLGTFVALPAIVAAGLFLAVVAAINIWGIREGLRANVVMTVVEVSGLVIVLALAGLVLSRGDGDLSRLTEVGSETALPAAAVLGAALLAFYSFVGFETSANIAEEAVDARRDYPRALFGALLTMIMASRLTYGMARERLLPAPLARVLPGRRTPVVAVLVTTAFALALALTGTVAALAETVVPLLLVVFLSANTAVLVLRWRERRDGTARTDHWRVWWPVPVLGIVAGLVLMTQQQPGTWLRAGLALLVGGVLSRVAARRGDTVG